MDARADEGRRRVGTFRNANDDGIGTALLELLRTRAATEQTPEHATDSVAIQTFFTEVSDWAPAFLQRRFGGQGRRCGDMLDIFDDAVQHLVVAVVEGRASGIAGGNPTSALAWCKRVLVNFVLDELRRQSRQVRNDPARQPLGDSFEGPVQTRHALATLVSELRREAARSAAPGKAKFRVALVDDFIASLLGIAPDGGRARLRDGLDQRRCRGRRVAIAAWRSLTRTDDGRGDLTAIASGLGLEDGDPS